MLYCSAVLPYLFKSTLFVVQTLGFLPFRYDVTRSQLVRPPLYYVYPIIFVGVLFTANGFCSFYLYPDTKSTMQLDFISEVPHLLQMLFGALYLFACAVGYVNHYVRLDGVQRCIEHGERLWRVRLPAVLSANGVQTPGFWDRIGYFVGKEIVLQLLLMYTYSIKIRKLSPAYGSNWVMLTIVLVPVLAISAMPALFYAGMLTVHFYFGQLNVALGRIVSEVGQPAESTFSLQRRCCELSDRLDAVAAVHLALGVVTQRMSALMSAPLCVWLTYKIVGILVLLFYSYMYVSDWLTVATFELASELLVSGLLAIVLSGIEMVMLAHACMRTQQEVRHYGLAHCRCGCAGCFRVMFNCLVVFVLLGSTRSADPSRTIHDR